MRTSYVLAAHGVPITGDPETVLRWERRVARTILRREARYAGLVDGCNVADLLRVAQACADLADGAEIPVDVHGIADKAGVDLAHTVWYVAVLIAAFLLEPVKVGSNPAELDTEDLAAALIAEHCV